MGRSRRSQSKHDSAVQKIARRLEKQGYTVAALTDRISMHMVVKKCHSATAE